MIESDVLTWNTKVANCHFGSSPRHLELLVAYHFQSASDSLPEEVVGIDGKLGNCLKQVVGAVNPHLALVRLRWGRGRGRLLRQLSDYAPK